MNAVGNFNFRKIWEVLGILVTKKKFVPLNMSRDDEVL